MTTTTVQPGVNLPSLAYAEDKVGSMFVQAITANEDGTLTYALDPEVLGDRYEGRATGGHVGLVPSWTTRGAEVGHLAIPAGTTVRAYATGENEVTVETPFGEVTFREQPVVVRHASIPGDAIKAYYAG